MTTKRETRTGEVGAVKADGTLEVLAVAYNVVDDYGSVWAPGVFERSASERLPVIAWAHSWDDPIGRATGYRDAEEGAYFGARLDIGGAVPRADQAFQQMSPGPNGEAPTLTDVSVGFMRRADEERDGVTVITKADLDEVSFVLRGAVPGAKVLAVRSARTGEQVDLDAVVAIAAKKAAGEIDQATADEALAMLSSPPATPPEPPAAEEPEALPELVDALAEADAALASLTDRSR